MSTINITTDTLAQIKLVSLPPNATALLDGQPAGPTVLVPVGRHTITLPKAMPHNGIIHATPAPQPFSGSAEALE